ncbi:aminoglycoside N(6')-acetyltransferase [Mesorhizobium sp. 113-3-9]|uniref:GNAT family N-acetyltransferase n=1 Tax=Mesorhizobium sp. 113-3-9 TaxID=2744517 RepID=UPI00192803FE|nr:GNAT family protein [Mesorhizobium sp. 113-3-9]BCG87094.1 aminoglycoside N(6')-acetyltransferase [Mesorhizobium sp. 113-3-9]
MTQATKPVLAGSRVTLRPLTRLDAPAIHAGLEEPESKRLTGTHAKHTLAEVEAHYARAETASDRCDYGIIAGGTLIGEAVLNGIDWPNKAASFRIAIWAATGRDKGYGTEAAALLLHHGFEALGLNRIELEVYAFNPRARRVYEKLGFRLEGTRREALIWDGEAVDAHIMGLLKREYSGTPPRVG